MSRVLIILNGQAARKKAAHWCAIAPINTRVEFKESRRSIPQNDRFWAMIGEVAQQVTWRDLLGRPFKMTSDQWKIFFLDMLNREALLVPNADGTGYVNLGRSSSDLSKAEMSDLQTLIEMFGAQHGVVFEREEVTA